MGFVHAQQDKKFALTNFAPLCYTKLVHKKSRM